MTKTLFQSNEILRNSFRTLLRSDGVLTHALTAADAEEDRLLMISVPTDLARDALRNAERVAVARYKATLLSLADIPEDKKEIVTADYRGKTPFDEAAEIPLPDEDKPI